MAEPDAMLHAAARTVLAETAFVRSDGTVGVAVVTPLVDDRDVLLALPYSERELAEALDAAESVALVASDDRLTLGGWQPYAAIGRVVVDPDPEGLHFRDRLIDEELRKHPPSRLLANSLMDRREHWWFMPRLLCRFVDLREVRAPAARSEPSTGVLAWHAAEGLQVDTVTAEPLGERDVRLRSLSGGVLAGAADPATLLRHDFSVPDLERRVALAERGRLESDVLRVAAREGTLDLPGPASLFARLRRQRAFSRACRRELARAAKAEDG